MNHTKGMIYYLVNYTAPKVFNGVYFECLLTDQKIPSHTEVEQCTGINIGEWDHDIYKVERFFELVNEIES